jgi:hypothetical protein
MHCYYRSLIFSHCEDRTALLAASATGLRSTVVSVVYSRMRSINMQMHDYIIHMVT